MPTMVLGEDGRLIDEKLGDDDARQVARNLHANTGEVVTLVPYEPNEDGEYEPNHDAAVTVGVHPEEQEAALAEASVANEELHALTVSELKSLAKERGVDVPAKAKKAELLAALEA